MTEPLSIVQLRLSAQRYDDLAALGLRRDPDLLESLLLRPGELRPAVRELARASGSTLAEVARRTSFPEEVELPAAVRLVLSVGESATSVAAVVPALNASLLGRLHELERLDPADDREREVWREAVPVAVALYSAVTALYVALLQLRLARCLGRASALQPEEVDDGRRGRKLPSAVGVASYPSLAQELR